MPTTERQPRDVDATFYVQIEPRWKEPRWYLDAAGNAILQAAKAVGITQERPRKQKPGTVLAKLTVRIPAGAFLPLAPEAVVVIPESMLVVEPLEVVATDAGDPQGEG